MAHLVSCRICKVKFDTDTIEWVMPSKNWYYHKKCYEDFGKKKADITAEADDEMWLNAAWQFLHREKRMPLNFFKFRTQWDSFITKKMTAKGIYFALRFFYDVQKGDANRAEGGIGIVPYIYDDSCQYWVNRNRIEKDIVKKIEDQVRQSEMRERKVVIKEKKNKKVTISLDDVVNMEEEDDS